MKLPQYRQDFKNFPRYASSSPQPEGSCIKEGGSRRRDRGEWLEEEGSRKVAHFLGMEG